MEFINYLKEPAFLVGVIVSLIIGFFYVLITPSIQRVQFKLKRKRSEKVLNIQMKILEEVKLLQKDRELQNSFKIDSLYQLLVSICFLIIGTIAIQLRDPMMYLLNFFNMNYFIGFEVVYLVIWLLSILFFTQGLLKFKNGYKQRNLVKIAEKREKLIRSYSTPVQSKINVIESWLDPKFKVELDKFDNIEFGIPIPPKKDE